MHVSMVIAETKIKSWEVGCLAKHLGHDTKNFDSEQKCIILKLGMVFLEEIHLVLWVSSVFIFLWDKVNRHRDGVFSMLNLSWWSQNDIAGSAEELERFLHSSITKLDRRAIRTFSEDYPFSLVVVVW